MDYRVCFMCKHNTIDEETNLLRASLKNYNSRCEPDSRNSSSGEC